MDGRQFFERVKIMRHFQKENFKTRSRFCLVEKNKANEGWISISESHPEPMQRVLVWIGDEALVCWYTKSGRFKTTLSCHERYVKDFTGAKFHLSSDRADMTDVISHWMPIVGPESVEEVKE